MEAKHTFTHHLAHLLYLATYPGTEPTVIPHNGAGVTVMPGVNGDAVAIYGDLQLHTNISTWVLWNGEKRIATEREPLIALTRFWEVITRK